MKWWRCLWIAGEISSLERVDPPKGASEACFDIPNGHGCFLRAQKIDGALEQARTKHPGGRLDS
jgi:hypothetical protein